MTGAIHSALADALPPNAAVTKDEYQHWFPTQALDKLQHSMRLDTTKPTG